MKPSSLTLLAALVLIGAGGFMAGRISAPTAEASAGKPANGPAATRSTRAAGNAGGARDAGNTSRRTRESDRGPRSTTERLAKLEGIVRGENPLDRNRALLAFIDQLGPGDFEAAVAHFRGLGITESRMGEYALLLSAWAEADPLAALAYAKTNTGNRFAADTILTTWASVDPEAAIRWAQADHTGEGANPHFAGIIRAIAATDPQRATQLLTGMPRSAERGAALEAMLPYVLAQGNEAARAWIEGLSDQALRDGAMMRSADRLAAADPAGTVTWLLNNPGEATQRRMDDVYSTWARMDEQAAMSSLARLPKGETLSDALRGVVSSVAVSDPARAVSVMNRYAADVDDRVVQNFVWHSFGNDPATAVGQIARIADTRERDQMYRRAVGRWLERDAAAATAWMNANPLPGPVQQELLRRASENPQ